MSLDNLFIADVWSLIWFLFLFLFVAVVLLLIGSLARGLINR